jgi:hypothetical protein
MEIAEERATTGQLMGVGGEARQGQQENGRNG